MSAYPDTGKGAQNDFSQIYGWYDFVLFNGFVVMGESAFKVHLAIISSSNLKLVDIIKVISEVIAEIILISKMFL